MKPFLYLILSASSCLLSAQGDTVPFFTTGITRGGQGEILLSQKGVRRVDVFSPDGKRLRSFPLDETPTGIAADHTYIYVTTYEKTGSLRILHLESGRTEAVIPAGAGAAYPVISPDGKRVYVCNRFAGTVSEIDVKRRKTVRSVRVLREPSAAVSDGRYLYVTNFLPAQRADVDRVASCVSVIELTGFTKVKDIPLASGSNALRGICITPDGKYIYVTHNLGRFSVPASQLQQGWMNTSALSIIDVEKQAYAGTVLTDDPERGAAGIWSVACNAEQLVITHSGTHEASIIDHPAMRRKLEATPDREALAYDLRFMSGIRKRIPLQGNGPRCMYLSGEELLVPTYFADVLNIVNVRTQTVKSVALNPGRVESRENRGEKYFNDAGNCFQNWQSCNGCHPGEGRMDGMNWDLLNDGTGNPKNCKSLLYSHATPPCMISGIRASAEIAVQAGFRHIQFFSIDTEQASCVDDYLKSLRPAPSPFLVNGQLSEKARKGKKIYEQQGCDHCHNGPYYTDMQMHRIGNDIEFQQGWDTPTLIEVWRTAPYLFDGRAATLNEVFEVHRHGINRKLSGKETEALVEYVNSL
jgi:YVTN family beta-propeller protein